MAVYITDPDIIDRICAVEGEAFRNNRPTDESSIEAFQKEWVRLKAEAEANGDDLTKQRGTVTTGGWNAAIYGNGGWNRYFVRYTGEVVYSRHHGSNPKLAEQVGFKVE